MPRLTFEEAAVEHIVDFFEKSDLRLDSRACSFYRFKSKDRDWNSCCEIRFREIENGRLFCPRREKRLVGLIGKYEGGRNGGNDGAGESSCS